MKIVSQIAVVLAVISGVLCVISRITMTPFVGINSQAMALTAGLLLLFSIALNTSK